MLPGSWRDFRGVRDRLRDGEETPLFTDQHVTPTRARQAAGTILELLNRDATGVVHVACRSCVTPYEIGQTIADRIAAPSGLIVEGSMADLDRPADRPAYSCLSVSKVEEFLGRTQPSLNEDLSAVF